MSAVTIAVNLVGSDNTGDAFGGAYGRIMVLRELLGGLADTAKTAFEDMTTAGMQLEMATTMAGIAISDGSQHVGELQQAIIDMANSSQYKIAEVDQAFRILGERGFNTAQILQGGLGQAAINLGQAMGETAVNGADVLSQALRLMTRDHNTASQAADKLTRAFYDGMPSASGLSSYLGQVGGTANVLGVSLSDLLTVGDMLTPMLGSASSAGASLNYMLRGLTAPTNKQAKEIKALGLNVFDAKGNFIGIQPVMDQLIQKFQKGHFTTQQMAVAMGDLFNVRSGRGAMDLVGMLNKFDPTYQKIKTDINQVGTAQKDATLINDTAQGSWKRLGSTFNDLLAKSGEFINTFLKPVFDWLNKLFSAMQKNQALTQFLGVFIAVGAGIALLTVAIIGIVLILTLFGAIVFVIIGVIILLAAIIAGIVVAILHWGTIVKWLGGIWDVVRGKIGDFFSWLGSTVHGKLNEAGAAIQGWGRSVGAWFTHAWDSAKASVGNFFSWLGTQVHNGLSAVGTGIHNGLAAVGSFFVNAWNDIKAKAVGAWNAIVSGISGALNGIKTVVSNVVGWVKDRVHDLLAAWQNFNTWMLAHNYYWHDIAAAVQTAVNNIRTAIANAVSWVKGAWSNVVSWTQSAWNTVTSTVGNAMSALGTKVHAGLEFVKAKATDAWNAIKDKAKGAWDAVSSTVGNAMSALGTKVHAGLETVKTNASNAWDAVRTKAQSAWAATTSTVGNAMSAIGTKVRAGFDAVVAKARDGWNQFVGAIRSAAGAVGGAVGGVINGIMNALGNLGGMLFNAGKNAINMLANGIKAAAGAVASAAGNVAHSIAAVLGFHSPTKEGPGRDADTWAPNLMRMVSHGLVDSLPQLESATHRVASTLKGAFGTGTGGLTSLTATQLALSAGINPGNGGQTIVIPISIGGTKLGDIVLDTLTGKLKQAGSSRMGR